MRTFLPRPDVRIAPGTGGMGTVLLGDYLGSEFFCRIDVPRAPHHPTIGAGLLSGGDLRAHLWIRTYRPCLAISPAFRRCSFRWAAVRSCLMNQPAQARAHEAGVAVEVEIWQCMGHVFQALPLPQARAALEHIARFVESHARWSMCSGLPTPCVPTEDVLAQALAPRA